MNHGPAETCIFMPTAHSLSLSPLCRFQKLVFPLSPLLPLDDHAFDDSIDLGIQIRLFFFPFDFVDFVETFDFLILRLKC